MHLDRAPRLVGSMANVFEGAVNALRLASDAEFTAMPDDLVREKNPFFARDDPHKVLLNLLRIIVRCQLQPARDSVNVSINNYSICDLEPRSQYNVRGFSGDAG